MAPDRELLDVTDTDQLRAMGHPTRLRLLLALRADGATISQLAVALETNKGNIAHHLAVLELPLRRQGEAVLQPLAGPPMTYKYRVMKRGPRRRGTAAGGSDSME